MANPFNNGTFIGNLAADPVVFAQSNGARVIKASVYARNNFVTKSTGKVESEKADFTQYVAPGKKSAFDFLSKGDMVAVNYRVGTDTYQDKTGATHYDLVLRVESLQFVESKTQTAARHARAAQSQPAQQAVAQPQPQSMVAQSQQMAQPPLQQQMVQQPPVAPVPAPGFYTPMS